MDLISVPPVDTGNAPRERLTRDASIHEPAGFALHSLLEFFAHSFLVSNGIWEKDDASSETNRNLPVIMHAPSEELPYATAKSARTLGKIRCVDEDFIVDEVPAYPPAGHGGHLFVRFEKRGLTTREAVTHLANALGVNPRDVGVAGQKDKRAVTTQWASFERVEPDAALSLEVPNVRVLAAVPHPHKLRTGHVRANRFELIIREASDLVAAHEVIAQLQHEGCPNYYGEQRFGVGERNVERACAMLRGEMRAPRDRFERKMLMSALQSSLFNRWLAERVTEGIYARPLLGDLLRKEDTGGLFINQDNDDALRRMQAWEVSATGPMFGASMRRAEAEAGAREQAIFESSGLTADMFAAHAKSGEGTRRAARVRLSDCEVERTDLGLRLRFTLPAGAYATTVLREVMKSDADARPD
jgi:tRNA pseudouridine13 synthase